MLASTVQFSNNTPTRTELLDSPTEPAVSQKIRADHVYCLERTPVLSGPNSVLIYPPAPRTTASAIRDGDCQRSTHEQPPENIRFRSGSATTRTHHCGPAWRMLLRKEVIQPHLPVRLPCYDFVPIADPTFDGSLHKG